jgi:hypothetical protein
MTRNVTRLAWPVKYLAGTAARVSVCSGIGKPRWNWAAQGASGIAIHSAILERIMKRTTSYLVAALAFVALSAQAKSTCQYIGNQRVCSDPYGNTATTQRIGNQNVTNYSDGQSATTQRIGSQTVTNYSNGESATSQQIGSQRVTNYSNGTSATTQQIGNQTVTNYSDGRTVTCQNIGNQRVCN